MFSATVDDSRHSDPDRRPSLPWRIGIVFTGVTGIWLLVTMLANAAFGPDYSRQSHSLRAILTSALAVPLVVLARRFLDRRPWSGLGLSKLQNGWRPLLIGIACWLIPATIGLTICIVFGWTEITLRGSIGDTVLLAAGLLLLVFLYEALPEELIFRGYFYRNLATTLPVWVAILGRALLFTLWGIANGAGNTIERSALFFTFSIILGIFRATTGSVWATIGFHLAFQTVAQLFGTIGNQFIIRGPEALSLFAFGMLPFGFSLVLLDFFYRRRPTWRAREQEDPATPKATKVIP